MHMYKPAEQQTEIRRGNLYWITSLKAPGEKPRPATWMLRNEHNPYSPYWRGLEIEAVKGEDPSTKVFRAAGTVLGIHPRFIEHVDTLQPEDHPGITQTTFVYTACGKAPNDPNKRVLPKPIVGLTLGIFALDAMPLDEMRPADAALIPDILQDAYTRGMGPLCMEYRIEQR